MRTLLPQTISLLDPRAYACCCSSTEGALLLQLLGCCTKTLHAQLLLPLGCHAKTLHVQSLLCLGCRFDARKGKTRQPTRTSQQESSGGPTTDVCFQA
ncbi:hypothetical protein GUJ93_ZPchr0005g16120 [Zizania palustris]|uniref:Uncharacterized protein n=1 Tax=Zizania palustris TaxID=103762 RepID=A0A8J5STR6_ZIZPA|nr:hypothetical protein GUJ93_ZPchr0005g16120 [Zizania palustris]